MRRRLSTKARLAIFQRDGGICCACGGKIGVGEPWDLHHVVPLALSGEDTEANLAPIHAKTCHRARTAGEDVPAIARAKRREARFLGARAPSRNPLPGGRQSPFKKRIDGTVIRREPHP